MTIAEAMSIVCDDAERWNANKLSEPERFEAIKIVRNYMIINPDLANIVIDYSDFRGVYGKKEE